MFGEEDQGAAAEEPKEGKGKGKGKKR